MTITRREAVVASLGTVIGIAIMVLYGIARTDALQRTLAEERMNTHSAFFTLAEQADRIEAIPESSASVRDCSERGRFEELLSRIPSLNRSERAELDILFASCGDYYARLKAYYADRLNELARTYTITTQLHNAIFASDPEHTRIEEAMRTIVTAERKRADDLYTLVQLQQDMNDVYAGRSTRTLSQVTDKARTVEKRLLENDAVADTASTKSF
jgi:hypothetical protein